MPRIGLVCATMMLKSLGVGLVVGVLGSYCTRQLKYLLKNPLTETSLMLAFGYLSYIIGEALHISGPICILTCGILLAHYAWYNLSTRAKITTR